MSDDSSSTITTAVTLAIVQTTQSDHERRIAVLEANYGRLIFWTVSATVSSFSTLCILVVTHYIH